MRRYDDLVNPYARNSPSTTAYIMKQNYKIVIAYDGTRYFGWEHQPNTEMTIQGKIETVLSRLAGEEIEVFASGRTDAGVHARAQVASFHLDTDLSEEELQDYMNHYLPDDICIRELKVAAERFHARYRAVGKTYRYTCYTGRLKPVWDRKYVWVLEETPDVEKMRQAAQYLIGTHDFAGFCGNPRMKKSTVRTVDSIEITTNGPYISLTFHGTGFLQYMVRILTGTLIEVGWGKRTPESMVELIEAKDRRLSGVTAPACGLTMMKVDYN